MASAIAAGGSWVAARRSNATSRHVAEIEAFRHQAEIKPEFRLEARAVGDNSVELQIEFVASAGLERLDAVTLSIRDDRVHLPADHAGATPADELARAVWGPCRFRRAAHSGDDTGRELLPFALALAETHIDFLERSPCPSWHDPALWDLDHRGKPIRLKVIVDAGIHGRWTIPAEVSVEPRIGYTFF